MPPPIPKQNLLPENLVAATTSSDSHLSEGSGGSENVKPSPKRHGAQANLSASKGKEREKAAPSPLQEVARESKVGSVEIDGKPKPVLSKWELTSTSDVSRKRKWSQNLDGSGPQNQRKRNRHSKSEGGAKASNNP